MKECALSCAAAMAAVLGTELGTDLDTLLKVRPVSRCSRQQRVRVHAGDCWLTSLCVRFQLLLERLQNETTRLPAVRAFVRVAQSPLPLDLSNVLETLLSELTSYLRKANRQLRQASLAAIGVGKPIHYQCLSCLLLSSCAVMACLWCVQLLDWDACRQ